MASWESAKGACSGGRRVSAMPDCGEWRRDTLILVVRMHVEGSNCDGNGSHAAYGTGSGGERRRSCAALSLSTMRIGAPHLGQSQTVACS